MHQAPDLFRLCKDLPPGLLSSPVSISFRPHLKAHRGKLLSGLRQKGTPVHAASFIRRREIVLETQLLKRPNKLKLIFVHELFHFVWSHLGNRRRSEFTALIQAELAARARGELGESAQEAKNGDFKYYVCESFCDTAAWIYAGVTNCKEFRLARRWHAKRRSWFLSTMQAGSRF